MTSKTAQTSPGRSPSIEEFCLGTLTSPLSAHSLENSACILDNLKNQKKRLQSGELPDHNYSSTFNTSSTKKTEIVGQKYLIAGLALPIVFLGAYYVLRQAKPF